MKNGRWRTALSAAIALAAIGAPASAQRVATPEELAGMANAFRAGWRQSDQPMRMSIPLHGGVLEFAMPHGFVPAFRVEAEGQFMMAFIPDGEAWPDFTRAVLVQSSAGLASAPEPTAEVARAVFAPRSCTGEPLWEALGEADTGSVERTFLASTGCAALGDNPAQSQQSFLAFLRGPQHAVALTYAVRGPSFAAASPPIAAAGARDQIGRFGPIILCRSAEQRGCRDIWLRETVRRNAGR